MKTDPIREQLFLIQNELIHLQFWQTLPPASDKLNSSEPFSIDTLAPEEWLQWILIPRMHALLDSQAMLPKPFEVAPYFEESWKQDETKMALIYLLQQLDKVINHG